MTNHCLINININCKGIITMKEYSGRTGITKWLYIHEDVILIVIFTGAPLVIISSLVMYLLWRF